MEDQQKAIEEITLSSHLPAYWSRRKREVQAWILVEKMPKKEKEVVWLKDDFVDAELYTTLHMLNERGIMTEYSCSGVSVLDDPLQHSLYAYITLPKTKRSTDYVEYLLRRMRHRLLVTYEPMRNRYDISSFFIQHNRSFCFILERFTADFLNRKPIRQSFRGLEYGSKVHLKEKE